jgi:RNA polymerase subunit RPABC4/transcription elongation factor Spt4
MLLDVTDTIQDSWADWAILAGLIFGAYLAVVWLASTYWTYKDIGARTRDQVVQVLMVLLVFVFFLPGLLLYLIIRPKLTLSERYDRNLEAEALLRELQEEPSCPFCRRKIGADFLACPYCRTTLGVVCDRCSRVLSFSWVMCPYCGTERSQPELTAGPAISIVPAPATADRDGGCVGRTATDATDEAASCANSALHAASTTTDAGTLSVDSRRHGSGRGKLTSTSTPGRAVQPSSQSRGTNVGSPMPPRA